MAILTKIAGNFVIFDDTVTSNPYGLVASNNLVLSQAAVLVDPIFLSAKNVLAMLWSTNLSGSTWRLFGQNDFAIIGQCMFLRNLVASSIFFISHAAIQTPPGDLDAVLSLSQSALCDLIKPGVSTITLTHVASCLRIGAQTPDNFFNMKGSAICWKLDQRFIATTFPTPDVPSDPNDGHCDP